MGKGLPLCFFSGVIRSGDENTIAALAMRWGMLLLQGKSGYRFGQPFVTKNEYLRDC
jgi:hypothetical protein